MFRREGGGREGKGQRHLFTLFPSSVVAVMGKEEEESINVKFIGEVLA